uniref:Uncharacterized protein n=1 Tax=Anguilla anguilla TaxID=7936 RepID=A0A0E9TT20_ANGAN
MVVPTSQRSRGLNVRCTPLIMNVAVDQLESMK